MHFRDIIAKDAHPAIITEKHHHPRGQRLGLHGHLPCPKCGAAMIGTRATGKTKTYRYYTCNNPLKYGTDKCDMDRLNADEVDTAPLGAMATFYGSHHDLMHDAVTAAQQVYESSHETVTTRSAPRRQPQPTQGTRGNLRRQDQDHWPRPHDPGSAYPTRRYRTSRRGGTRLTGLRPQGCSC
ncbi:zinc ribbon domain-containing protein [Saccharothrix australiensis]|nr:zinc ribbon domain-containing protein [Saccharothrix australiensis]